MGITRGKYKPNSSRIVRSGAPESRDTHPVKSGALG